MPENRSKLKSVMRKVEKPPTHNKENVKDAHNTRSRKVKENASNNYELMSNRELRIVIRKENIENGKKTQLKSSNSCRSTQNRSNNLQKKYLPNTRSEKANINEFGLKLKENTDNKQNDVTTDSQKLNSTNNIDKIHQKCIVKLVKLKTLDEKKGVLKDSNISNTIEVSNKNRIITNKRLNGYSSDLFEDSTISKSNASTIENPMSKLDTLEASIVRHNGDISNTSFIEASAILHSSTLDIETSTPLRSSDPTTPVVKRLRNNDKKNYRESSLSLTEQQVEVPFENNAQKKVPVYKRIIPDHHKPKADQYEFDDVDFDVQYRKKKRNNSGKFDKTMHSILEKLEKKDKKNQKNMKKRCNKKAAMKVPVYEIKVNAAVEKVMNKIKAKRNPLVQNGLLPNNHNNQKENNEKESEMQNQHTFGVNSKNKNHQIKLQDEAIPKDYRRNQFKGLNKNNNQLQKIVLNGYNNKLQNNSNTLNKILDNKDVKIIESSNNHSSDIFADAVDDNCFEYSPEPVVINSLTLQSPLGNSGTSIHSSHSNTSDISDLSEFYGFSNNRSMLVLDRSDETDSFHGFDVEEQSRALQKSVLITNQISFTLGRKDTSINILGNVVVRPAQRNLIKTTAPFDYFMDLHENYILDNYFGFNYDEEADSIMMAHAEKNPRQVWRFANVIKRNPHFLFIKSNALPCLNQDLIIDYALVEWIENRAAVNKSNNPQTVKDTPACMKVTRQKKILEYIECPVRIENDYEDEVVHSSLYDYEEFQIPVKPRRVFGILQNEQVISTPKRHVKTVIPFPDVSIIEKDKENSDGPDIENAENTPPEHTLKVREGLHGMRKYSKKSKDKQDVVEKEVNQQQLNSDSDDNSDNNSDIVTEGERQNMTNDNKGEDEFQLFDEDEPELLENESITIPKMNYARKRRKRLQSEGVDVDDDRKSKKKKKDMMTKEEEIEFEKWASKFNAMCDEVEKYELEVD